MQSFSAQPRAVGSRPKYRADEYDDQNSTNLMYDKRVVRGNTYAALVMPQQPDPRELEKQREAQRQRLARANRTQKRVGTPEPVMGRKHIDIQTDTYLEELTERTVEFEAETQTDFLLDRPHSPLFMPAKVGQDTSTQIEEGELFDFDREVEPVLEVLVGKTLEQSMMEVLEEEELASIRRHQEEFEQARNAELLEVQRMEAVETRRKEEADRRRQQETAKKEQEDQITRKVMSRSMARSYLGGLPQRILEELEDSGLFSDPKELAVEQDFMPWLVDAVAKEVQESQEVQQAVEGVLASAIEDVQKPFVEALQMGAMRQEQVEHAMLRQREEARERETLLKQEADRISAEQKAMQAWEMLVEEVPPEIIDVFVRAPGLVAKEVGEGEEPVQLLDCVRNEDREAVVPDILPTPDQIAHIQALLEAEANKEAGGFVAQVDLTSKVVTELPAVPEVAPVEDED
mmetsp:Transcript_10760/g.23721  ORF Transcript_10760/g.23721 Transcript_10760/m.23721 type:complete len:460 (-) Transcript_10760:343-1722(-)